MKIYIIYNHIRRIFKISYSLPSVLKVQKGNYNLNISKYISEQICNEVLNITTDIRYSDIISSQRDMGILKTHNSKLSSEIILESFKSISADQYISCVDSSIALWRETCADLNMCAICRFDEFGYFKFSCDELSSDNNYSSTFRNIYYTNFLRIKYVLATLITKIKIKNSDNLLNNQQEIDMSDLVPKIKQYIVNLFSILYNDDNNIYKYTTEKIYDEHNAESFIYEFLSSLSPLSKYLNKLYVTLYNYKTSNDPFIELDIDIENISNNILYYHIESMKLLLKHTNNPKGMIDKMSNVVSIDYSYFSDNDIITYDEPKIMELLTIFSGSIVKHFSRTLSRIDCVYKLLNETLVIDYEPELKLYYTVDTKVLNNFIDIYKICVQEQITSKLYNSTDIIKYIQQYYNNACDENFKKFSNHDLLQKSTEFVLQYYYNNRACYSSFLDDIIKFKESSHNTSSDDFDTMLHQFMIHYHLL